MTRTVSDAALMLTVMAGPDLRDWYCLAGAGHRLPQRAGRRNKGCRIAYSRTLGYAKVDPEVVRLVDKAVDELAALGAKVEETRWSWKTRSPSCSRCGLSRWP